MSMNDANLDRIMHNSDTQWKRRFVIVAFHDMHVGGDGSQVVIGLFVANVACAKNLLNLSWNQKLLKFRGQVVYTMRYVKVPDDKNKDHGVVQSSAIEVVNIVCFYCDNAHNRTHPPEYH
jgi:hypothetical protein